MLFRFRRALEQWVPSTVRSTHPDDTTSIGRRTPASTKMAGFIFVTVVVPISYSQNVPIGLVYGASAPLR
jgi:hypothetical protein